MNGPSFTSKGTKYFHFFNISLCGHEVSSGCKGEIELYFNSEWVIIFYVDGPVKSLWKLTPTYQKLSFDCLSPLLPPSMLIGSFLHQGQPCLVLSPSKHSSSLLNPKPRSYGLSALRIFRLYKSESGLSSLLFFRQAVIVWESFTVVYNIANFVS